MEKFQAMVALGHANSRMKDFYDIWLLSQSFPFDDDRLARAIAATFERRETEIPAELPDALTLAFAEDEQKQRQMCSSTCSCRYATWSIGERSDRASGLG